MDLVEDRPIAHQLAEELEDAYQKARDSAESVTRYLDEDGSLCDLSGQPEEKNRTVKGLAYEFAAACAEAQTEAEYILEDSNADWEDAADAAKDFLSRELGHIKRECLTTIREFEASGSEEAVAQKG